MNLWLWYPMEKAVSFMRATDWEMRCHVLRIGPLAFCVIWRTRRGR